MSKEQLPLLEKICNTACLYYSICVLLLYIGILCHSLIMIPIVTPKNKFHIFFCTQDNQPLHRILIPIKVKEGVSGQHSKQFC